jgi:hypothetical protein
MAGRPSFLQIPFKSNIVEKTGAVSQIWQDFFRGVKSHLNSKYEAATAPAFSLATSGYASGEWAQMTLNKVNLSPGIWMLTGQVLATWSSSAPTWTHLQAQWSLSNGANTSSVPTVLPVLAGNTLLAQALATSGGNYFTMPSVRVAITEPTDIYLVPSATFSAAGNAYLQTYIYAERMNASIGDST